jgi:RNA polymerase sigma factor (sigma-70 family)
MQDWQLLKEYVEHDSQPAFSSLVERYLNLVYTTCLREVGDATLAEDVTQVVFILLARKAKNLHPQTVLSGWLFQTARFSARNARKQEERWRQRTAKAAEMISNSEHGAETDYEAADASSPEAFWSQVEPLIHQALTRLNEIDRNAVLLRYFQGRSLKETGDALGLSEEAARKRVARALEKMRRDFSKRGITLSALTLASLLSGHALQAAPISSVVVAQAALSAGAAGATLVAGGASVKVLALSDYVARALWISKLKVGAAILCGGTVASVGTSALVQHHLLPLAKMVASTQTASPKNVRKPDQIVVSSSTRVVRQRPTEKRRALRNAKPVATPLRLAARPISTPLLEEQIAKKPHVKQVPRVLLTKQIRKSQLPAATLRRDRVRDAETPVKAVQAVAAPMSKTTVPTKAIRERSQEVQVKKTLFPAIVGATMAGGLFVPNTTASAEEPTKSTLAGLLVAKSANSIDVRADGEKEAKRYIPMWIGGLPKDGGGPDAATVEAIKKLRVPNRVRLNWEFQEHLRVLRVEVVEPATNSGIVNGEVTAKGDNWIEVKPVGEAPAERYSPRWFGGLPKDGGSLDKAVMQAIAQTQIGDKVKVSWIYQERLRVVELTPDN